MKKRSDSLATVPHAPIVASKILSTLAKEVNEAGKETVAGRSRLAYEGDWERFAAWCSLLSVQALPASPSTIAMYLKFLFNRTGEHHMQMTSITRALSGIAHGHRTRGFDWARTDLVTGLLKWMRKKRAEAGERRRQAKPVTAEILHEMLALLGNSLVDRRARAILLIGWIGALRRDEIARLDVDDVTIEKEGLSVRLKTSKTDQEGKNDDSALPASEFPELCPREAFRAWLEASNITSGPLFRGITRDGLLRKKRFCGDSISKMVKKLVAATGQDPAIFSGHSLRRGFATTAAEAGRSLDAVMRQTRHKDPAVAQQYIDRASRFKDNAAKGLLKRQ